VTTRIKEKMELKAKLEKSREQNIGDVKKLESRIEKTNSDVNSLQRKLGQLLNDNPWVRVEKDMFSNPESSEYSGLTSLDVPNAKLQYHRLQDENEKLKKMINVKVDQMSDQAEREYTELIKKRDKMMTDKTTIEKQI